MPKLKALHDKYKDKGLVIIGVHVAKQQEKMEEFVKDQGILYPCVADPENATTKEYGVRGIPHMLLIDRKGIIRSDDAHADVVGDGELVKKLVEEKAPEKKKGTK